MANQNNPPRTETAAQAAQQARPADADAAAEPSAAAAGSASGSSDRELGFDQVLDRLRQVVSRLEQGSLSLEQALLAFEDGVRLSRRGGEILDQAEQRVELLLRGEDGDRRQPLGPQPAPASPPAAD